MQILYFLILIFLSIQINAKDLKQSSFSSFAYQDAVHTFFQNQFETTTAGYVIFGEKPVYLGSFCQPEWLMPGSNNHKDAVCAFLALKALNQLPINKKSSNYILVSQIDLQKDFPSTNELLLINRKALLKTIEENLSLFKYKLGYNLTAESLLKQLMQTDYGFSKLFGNEIALQGIILGYGTSNAISYEIASPFAEPQNTPTHPLNQLPPPPTSENEMISRLEKSAKRKGLWERVKEETKDVTYYRPQNSNDTLKIPFSFHQNSKETKELFKMYQAAESKLKNALKAPDFLTLGLKKLGVSNKLNLSLIKNNLVLTKQSLSQTLGRSIKYTFSEQISPEFIEGMKAAQKQGELNLDFEEIRFLEILRIQGFSDKKRRKYEQETKPFLLEIASNADTHCLIPNKLYYRTLKHGNTEKPVTSNHKFLDVNYHIKDISSKSICGVYKGHAAELLNQERLIPGLAHGLLGAYEGEVREIYIHPDFAYGTDSEFAEGKALKVQIEVLKAHKSAEAVTLPNLQPIDVQHIAPKIESCDKYTSLQKKYNFFCGAKTWLHYKKAVELLDLNAVLEEVSSKTSSYLSEKDREIISMLNWSIYQNTP
jgi:FKBP-type peptidyl-prolyl cis-trans isomerase